MLMMRFSARPLKSRLPLHTIKTHATTLFDNFIQNYINHHSVSYYLEHILVWRVSSEGNTLSDCDTLESVLAVQSVVSHSFCCSNPWSHLYNTCHLHRFENNNLKLLWPLTLDTDSFHKRVGTRYHMCTILPVRMVPVVIEFN